MWGVRNDGVLFYVFGVRRVGEVGRVDVDLRYWFGYVLMGGVNG